MKRYDRKINKHSELLLYTIRVGTTLHFYDSGSLDYITNVIMSKIPILFGPGNENERSSSIGNTCPSFFWNIKSFAIQLFLSRTSLNYYMLKV
jgi:hypothetical protein